MHILVTGGAGFIGRHLVNGLIERGHAVSVVDNLDPQVHGHDAGEEPPKALHDDAQFVCLDIRNRDALGAILAEEGIQCIYHLAAAVGVGQSMYEIDHYTSVNAGGTGTLMDALANVDHDVERCIVASSNLIYGEGAARCPRCDRDWLGALRRDPAQLARGQWELRCPACDAPCTPIATPETKTPSPRSVYAETKRFEEALAMIVGDAYGIPTSVARFFNVYGAGQSLTNPYTGVFGIFVSRVACGEVPVLYEDGVQSRDLVHVDDVVDGLLRILERDGAAGERFNIGSGRATTVAELATRILDAFGIEARPEILHRYRQGDIRHCYADISKARSILGFEPNVSLETGLERFLRWAREQRAEDRFDEAGRELSRRGLV